MANTTDALDELIKLLSALKERTESRIRETIEKIITLAYEYPYHNKQFTFDKDKNLEDSVNGLLIDLTNAIILDIESYTRKAQQLVSDEDNNDLIFGYISREINGEDLTERLDKHMTRLKNSLEAFIAIGFANFMSARDILTAFLRNIDNPFGWQKMIDAYKDNLYEAESIRSKGFVFGKKIERNINKAVGLVLSGAMIGSYDYALQLKYQSEGAIGWTTVRGSSYDCELCDSMVGVVHPMTEIFTGWHPRCMCILQPVYGQE